MSNVKAITTNIVENSSMQKTLFRSMVIVLALMSFTYLYFISSITFNVLARKSLDTTVRNLENSISTSEITYMEKLNKIDKNYALANGFVEVNQSLFAVRDAARVAIR
ncbi:MAG: hypothetical protein WCK91_02125 [bacterium]